MPDADMAVAGPSTPSRAHTSDATLVYAAQLDDGVHLAAIHAHDDLMGRLRLGEAYDRFVRPYQPPLGGQIRDAVREQQGKGKGRATGEEPPSGIVVDPSQRKLERGYAYLVRDVPARKSGVKGQHLMRLVQDPDLQPVTIAPLPTEAIRDGFTLQAGQIEGLDPNTWTTDADRPAKGPRKKRQRDDEAAAATTAPAPTASDVVPPPSQPHSPPRKKRRKGGVAV